MDKGCNYLSCHELSKARWEGQRCDEECDQGRKKQAPEKKSTKITLHTSHNGANVPPKEDENFKAMAITTCLLDSDGFAGLLLMLTEGHRRRIPCSAGTPSLILFQETIGTSYFFMRKRLMAFCLRMN